MDFASIKAQAWKMMGKRLSHSGRETGYIYYHGQRVAQTALQLRELIFPKQSQDDDVILVGGWFHDVGKGIEPHWEYGAILAEQILRGYCPQPQLTQIVQIVAGHTLRKEREYPYYVQLVQDADILDHFGTQEIWLNFLTTVHNGGSVNSSLEYFDTKYTEHVEKVRSLLNFPQSVDIYNEKDRFVQGFMERFRLESTGDLWGIRKN